MCLEISSLFQLMFSTSPLIFRKNRVIGIEARADADDQKNVILAPNR